MFFEEHLLARVILVDVLLTCIRCVLPSAVCCWYNEWLLHSFIDSSSISFIHTSVH